MNGRVKLDSIVCLIDALNYESLLTSHTDIALDQLEFADFIVLNKCDLISDDKKKLLHTLIRRVNALAPIMDASHGNVDLALLLSTGRFAIQSGMEDAWKDDHTHGHDDLQVFAYKTQSCFKARELDEFFKDLTTDCYRVK